MNQMCPSCGFDVHVDDTQAPPYPFAVECPRCRKQLTMQPPARPEATLWDAVNRTQGIGGAGNKFSTGQLPQYNSNTMGQFPAGQQSVPPNTPPPNFGNFNTGTNAALGPQTFAAQPLNNTQPINNLPEMMQTFIQMMTTAISNANAANLANQGTRPAAGNKSVDPGRSYTWSRRQVLLCCVDPKQRQLIENSLDKQRYDLTVSQTAAQAIEIMQDFKSDLVILDPQFDASRQGGIAILRHISSLMPKYRRKIYVVLVSPQVKTLDTYMAFLNCVNLTVNTEDLDSFQAVLEKSIRDFNELYRPFQETGGTNLF
jgi:CheY-like chemotaxis protein